MASLPELERVIEGHDYAPGIAYCRAALAMPGEDKAFWFLNLGLLYFLNEMEDIEAYHTEAVPALESAVAIKPSDPELHFWLGYLYTIIKLDQTASEHEIRTALRISPKHPYALIVLAGGLANPIESIDALKHALEGQPNNYRALQDLSRRLVHENRHVEARRVLEQLLGSSPYIERSQGIMNDYVNGVLTNAHWAERIRRESNELMEQIGSAPAQN